MTFLLIWVATLIFALFVHEGAHWAAARALGYPATFVISRLGPGARWGSDDVRSSYRDRMVVAAAGPAANVALAAAAYASGMWLLALGSLVVGVPQLIPVGPSDARSVLRALRRQEAVT